MAAARSGPGRLVGLAAFVALSNGAGCNALLGNEEPTLDVSVRGADASDTPSPDGEGDSMEPAGDASIDVGAIDAAREADAGPRVPAAACVKSNASVTPNAVRRVEIDTTPAPVVTSTTFTASFTIYGDNALSDVHLDFCTADGLVADVGGGTTFLGGGGAVTRRWQTKAVATVPTGRVQAQVYSESPAVLRFLTNIDLY